MLGVARRILRCEDDARDAVQEAFLAAFRTLARFEGASALGTWLHRIAVNAALKRLRARRRRPEANFDELLPRFDATGHRLGVRTGWTGADGASDTPESRREWRARVAERLAELPEAAREIIVLRDVLGLDTAATAQALGITEGAAKVRLHRARMALRALLELDRAGASDGRLPRSA